jgi:hypothetical protein
MMAGGIYLDLCKVEDLAHASISLAASALRAFSNSA